MNNEEWQERMNELHQAQLTTQNLLLTMAERHDREIGEIRDSQLVMQRLMEENERKWAGRFERHDEEMGDLRAGLADLRGGLTASRQLYDVEMAEFRAGMQELRAAMNSLIAHIDRFVQGRNPNGH